MLPPQPAKQSSFADCVAFLLRYWEVCWGTGLPWFWTALDVEGTVILAQAPQESGRGDRARPIALSAKIMKNASW